MGIQKAGAFQRGTQALQLPAQPLAAVDEDDYSSSDSE